MGPNELSPADAAASEQPPSAAPTPSPAASPSDERRSFRLPLALFVATCLSTYWAAAVGADPASSYTDPASLLASFVNNAPYGLAYMAAIMAILAAHEMGHFLQAVRYRMPVDWPLFLPMPVSPLGTLGAVILLRGRQANRKELFDVGLTGPLAGLLLALPLACIGIRSANAAPYEAGGVFFGDPLAFRLLVAWLRPDVASASQLISHANPLVMASWVGFFVTGLNMLPIGQLDGGHVTYALFGKRAHWLARLMVLGAAVFIIYTREYNWSLFLALTVFFGINHPPTADDRAKMGRWRTILGWVSLAIPIFCLPPFPIVAT